MGIPRLVRWLDRQGQDWLRYCLLCREAKAMTNGLEKAKKLTSGEINDAATVLTRMAAGDTIVFSQDGDDAWFTKGDRAFVGNVIIELRKNGWIERRCDDEENYRGMSEYDAITPLGLTALQSLDTGGGEG